MGTALGAAAMPTLAGCSGSSDDETESPAMQPTMTQSQAETEEQSDDQTESSEPTIDPRFGFIVAGDGSAPVEQQ
jgi:hypothetical protein